MKRTIFAGFAMLLASQAFAQNAELNDIRRAALDYIESQHVPNPDMMRRGIDEQLAKRTYWQDKQGSEFIMETSGKFMVQLAETYNKNGDRFPDKPLAKVTVLDVDQRVASVKLEADEWIDYMHLYKNDQDQWKILNVLWQYKDTSKHKQN